MCYSGRDDSIMDALAAALDRDTSFPSGLFWLHRGEGPPLPRVRRLLTEAARKSVDGGLVQIENFDEALRDLVRLAADRFVDIVNEGFDIAIRAGTLSDSQLVARKLTDMRRVTCASPDYLAARGEPLTPQDLNRHDGLVSTNAPESAYWHYTAPDGETYLARPTTRMKTNNGEAVITAAVAGLGIAAVPAFISNELIDRGALKPILHDYRLAAGSLYAIYSPGRHLSHRVRVLIDFLAARFAFPIQHDAHEVKIATDSRGKTRLRPKERPPEDQRQRSPKGRRGFREGAE